MECLKCGKKIICEVIILQWRNGKKAINSILVVLFAVMLIGCGAQSPTSNCAIALGNIINTDTTSKVVFTKGNYYYYDSESEGIMCYTEAGESEKIIETDEIYLMAGNDNSLFFADMEVLYQYQFEDGSLIQTSVIGGDWIEQIYANDEYLFVMGGEHVYLYSAKNILETIEFPAEFGSLEPIWIMCVSEFEDELIIDEKLQSVETEQKDNKIIFTPKNEFNEVMFMLINSETGNKIIGTEDYIGVYDDSLLMLCGDLNLYTKDGIKTYSNGTITYEIATANCDLECSTIKDNVLIMVGSSYGKGDFPTNMGTLAEHEMDNVWYVDLEKQSTWKSYTFDKAEIVWYADLDKYILFNNGTMTTYDTETQEELFTNEAEWFDEESGYQYEVVLCHDKWFIFNEMQLVDVVAMEEYLN